MNSGGSPERESNPDPVAVKPHLSHYSKQKSEQIDKLARCLVKIANQNQNIDYDECNIPISECLIRIVSQKTVAHLQQL